MSGGGPNNLPRPLTLTPPGAPDGDAFAEIRLDYPDGVKLVMASHANGVRVYGEQFPAQADGEPPPEPRVLIDLVMPWDAWYKVRAGLLRQKS